jgi:hypothetical protein
VDDVMAVLKWLPLAFAVAALSGCSAPGSFSAPSSGTPTAWDLHGPREQAEGSARRSTRVHHPSKEIITGSIDKGTAETTPKPFSKEWLAKQEALNRAFDAALLKKMTICRSC